MRLEPWRLHLLGSSKWRRSMTASVGLGGLLSLTDSLLTPAKLLCRNTPPSLGLTEFYLQNGVDFWP